MVVTAGAAGVAWTRWLLPASRGLERVVATATLGTGTLLVVAQLVGLVGAFRLAPVVLGCLVATAAALALARRAPIPTPIASGPPVLAPEPRWVPPLAAAAVGAGAVQWTVAVVPTVRRGFADVDGLHYHLTHAAGYAQSGRLLPVQVLDVGHPSG